MNTPTKTPHTADTLHAIAATETEAHTNQQNNATAAMTAESHFAAASPCSSHAYLTARGIQPYGIRQADGNLLIPMRDVAGTVQGLQAITPDGHTEFFPHDIAKGCCHLIDGTPDALLICESYAVGASLHEATGYAVAVAVLLDNLEAVALALKAEFPDVPIIIAADNDNQTPGQPSLTAANTAAQVVGCPVAVPDFGTNKESHLKSFHDLHQLWGLEAVKCCIDAVMPAPLALLAPTAPAAPQWAYTLHTADHLRTIPLPPWRIKNTLPPYGTAVIYGESGSGKSFLVLDMCLRLISGGDWFGHKVNPCTVTYVMLEGEYGFLNRLEAYRTRYGAISNSIRFVAQPFSLLNTDNLSDLIKAIQAEGTGDVVVLDTLSRAMPGGNENDGKDMGEVIAASIALQQALDGLVLLVHHTGKDASRGMRGHSSLIAAVDCAIEVKRRGDEREWLVAKSKDGEDGASHPFTLEVVQTGTDSDGDAITSCVVVPAQSEPPGQPAATKGPKLVGNQSIAHKALQDHLNQLVTTSNGGAPPGVAGIQFDEALKLVAPLIETDPKHQKERAKDAIKALITKGVLIEGDEGLTIPHPAPQS